MKIEIDKPVVPKWFDEWYKTFGGYKSVALYHLNRTGWGYALTEGFNDEEVSDWARKLEGVHKDMLEAQEYLSKAILFGYEVERPLYYARMKGSNLVMDNIYTYWRKALGVSKLGLGCKQHEDVLVKTKMTKEEWNELGINDTNADFEKVEDLKND